MKECVTKQEEQQQKLFKGILWYTHIIVLQLAKDAWLGEPCKRVCVSILIHTCISVCSRERRLALSML